MIQALPALFLSFDLQLSVRSQPRWWQRSHLQVERFRLHHRGNLPCRAAGNRCLRSLPRTESSPLISFVVLLVPRRYWSNGTLWIRGVSGDAIIT